MKDKVTLLMEETGCDRSEAELALQLCGYDLESAVQAVPRLFQNIVILKGRFCVRKESLYGLCLAILNLKEKRLLRARAVISYNPAVYASELDQHWFDFEGRLYACRLWPGTMQAVSQEAEGLLAGYFDSPEAGAFYEEGASVDEAALEPLKALLGARLGAPVDLQFRQDVLDLGQFREVRPQEEGQARPTQKRRTRGTRAGPGAENLLILRIAVEPDPEGTLAEELHAGDLVHVAINDGRDIAQYLARLFGAAQDESMAVPVEAIEKGAGEVTVRVRFSAGVCGDVSVPGDLRVRAERRLGKTSWWKKFLGG